MTPPPTHNQLTIAQLPPSTHDRRLAPKQEQHVLLRDYKPELRHRPTRRRHHVSCGQVPMLEPPKHRFVASLTETHAHSYLIRPSPIHSRKLFINRAKSFRHNDLAGADPMGSARHEQRPFEQASGPAPGFQQASAGHQQSRQTPSSHIKSCLSDGDFNQILIKVNDDEQTGSSVRDRILSPVVAGSESHESLRFGIDSQRRRSSCSDADEQQSQNRWRDSLA